MSTFLIAVPVLFAALIIGMQLWIRTRARAMRGAKVPSLPGPTGARLSKASRALVYFFSPSCGACKAFTPKFQALSKKNRSVFAVDVFQDMELARGLKVMGTPSVVEIEDGTIVGYWVGAAPAEVLARYS